MKYLLCGSFRGYLNFNLTYNINKVVVKMNKFYIIVFTAMVLFLLVNNIAKDNNKFKGRYGVELVAINIFIS